jgi:hypothetical protein
MLLSIRSVEVEDEDTGQMTTRYALADADGRGYGDVVRAVAMTGYGHIPRSRPHPALLTYATREEAVAAAEALGDELARRQGGAYELLGG